MQSYENANMKLFFSFVKAKTWTFITKKRRNALLSCTPSLLFSVLLLSALQQNGNCNNH